MYDPASLERKTPADLQARRDEILTLMNGQPLADAPTELLQELAYIFTALRRKTSGPPREAKPSKRAGPKVPGTIDDLMAVIS